MTEQSQFCPKCGAGVVSVTDHIMTIRCPIDYPFESPCDECDRRSAERLRAAGQRMAQQFSDRFWEAFTKDTGAKDAQIEATMKIAEPVAIQLGVTPEELRAVVTEIAATMP